jgi:hypothetical protein
MAGKGDKRRSAQITQSEWDRKYERTFGKGGGDDAGKKLEEPDGVGNESEGEGPEVVEP